MTTRAAFRSSCLLLVATIGLGACVVARWIFREPLRNLFRD